MTAPTAFTMQDVVNGVLLQMRFAPGRDVQIHLQDSIVQDASILYRTLMQKFIWRDFIHMTPFQTEYGGTAVDDLTGVLGKFSDILNIYRANEEFPLPFAPALINPNRIRTPTIVPAGVPNIFMIYPTGKVDNYILWSRNYTDKNFDLDDEVPFYKDVLVLGTAFNLATKAGINKELTESLKSQFDSLVKMYITDEVKDQYSTRPMNSGNVMTDWYVTDSSP